MASASKHKNYWVSKVKVWKPKYQDKNRLKGSLVLFKHRKDEISSRYWSLRYGCSLFQLVNNLLIGNQYWGHKCDWRCHMGIELFSWRLWRRNTPPYEWLLKCHSIYHQLTRIRGLCVLMLTFLRPTCKFRLNCRHRKSHQGKTHYKTWGLLWYNFELVQERNILALLKHRLLRWFIFIRVDENKAISLCLEHS